MIELNSKNNRLRNTIMEETGGIGVDILVDNGGKFATFSRCFTSRHPLLVLTKIFPFCVRSAIVYQ